MFAIGLVGLRIFQPALSALLLCFQLYFPSTPLTNLSIIKANSMGLYYAHRDWLSVAGDEQQHASRFKSLFDKLMDAIVTDLSPKGRSDESLK